VFLQTFHYNTIIKLIARQGRLYIGKSLRSSDLTLFFLFRGDCIMQKLFLFSHDDKLITIVEMLNFTEEAAGDVDVNSFRANVFNEFH
jgi:hypothetical protein